MTNKIIEFDDVLKRISILNEYLRNYGQLGDSEKPIVVSAILLALRENTFNINMLTGDTVKTDGEIIFETLVTHISKVKLTSKEEILNQFNIIKNIHSLNQIDKRLNKTPIKYFAEYLKENIYSAIVENSSEDILGIFYGGCSYSGGNGQTLGIVLTPKHITELFCDLVDLKSTDNIIDPCCGTGGFLIAAMNKMLCQAKEEEKKNIKAERIHGIEIREDMFSIATTNMILRGNGKSNLIKDDFLKRETETLRKNNYNIGFMNPPYSQGKKGKDTDHLSEIQFIKHLLDGLADNGKCAVIVPQSTMVGNKKEDKKIKKQILQNHTLEGVITLNKETFYGVGTNPCIAIFTAHKPHSEKKYCKFINFENDGFETKKHIGLVETERAKEKKTHLLNCWLHEAPAENKFMVKTTITTEDEWLHSFYYFNDEIPIEEDFEKTIADYLSF